MGFEYLGLDYSGDAATVRGDAHRLPFGDDSFDLVLSLAVFEHLQHPLVASDELCRVMKPGAIVIGSVAFAEPFHQHSYFHHTHIGIANTLAHSGLEIVHLAANESWTVLTAFTDNALFPRMPRWLRRSLVWPLSVLHRSWWYVGGRLVSSWSAERRLALTSGAWTFIAVKPQ